MIRKTIFAAAAAALAALLTPADAQAWGAAHVGYTHVGPAGVQHYGATAVRGPYGAYGGAHVGGVGYGGAYGATRVGGVGYGGAAYGGGYHYNTGYGAGGYHYGAVGAGGYGAAAGVYRRW